MKFILPCAVSRAGRRLYRILDSVRCNHKSSCGVTPSRMDVGAVLARYDRPVMGVGQIMWPARWPGISLSKDEQEASVLGRCLQTGTNLGENDAQGRAQIRECDNKHERQGTCDNAILEGGDAAPISEKGRQGCVKRPHDVLSPGAPTPSGAPPSTSRGPYPQTQAGAQAVSLSVQLLIGQ
jgi:hypothetical protein